MVLACFIAVLVASIPAPRPGWLWRVVLAVSVTALTFVVFELGLQMGLPLSSLKSMTAARKASPCSSTAVALQPAVLIYCCSA